MRFTIALGAWLLCAQLSLSSTLIDLIHAGTFVTNSFSLDGVTITGSGQLQLTNLNGLGVVGGENSTVVDSGEYVTVSFQEPVAELSYYIDLASQFDSLPVVGTRSVSAYGENGALLGTYLENDVGSFPVSDRFSTPISKFVLTSEPETGFRVGSIRFSAIPEPSGSTAIPLAAMLLLSFAAVRGFESGK